MTIEDLGKKIDGIDKKFSDKIDQLDGKIGTLDKKIDDNTQKLDGHIDTLAIITSKGFERNTKQHEAFIKRFDILEKDHDDDEAI